jgi:CDGSH-type Zn-finger protein
MTTASDVKKRILKAAQPACPQVGPYAVWVEEGKRYRWCSCGLSATQPWCDESHIGTAFSQQFEAPITSLFLTCAVVNAPTMRCITAIAGHPTENGGGGSISLTTERCVRSARFRRTVYSWSSNTISSLPWSSDRRRGHARAE